MRQRQPDGANLLPSWREIVEDAPRDDQMRLGVVMAQNETCSKEDGPCDAARERGGDGEQMGKRGGAPRAARYNHVSAAQHNANRCSPSSNGSTGSRSHSAGQDSSSSHSSTLRS